MSYCYKYIINLIGRNLKYKFSLKNVTKRNSLKILAPIILVPLSSIMTPVYNLDDEINSEYKGDKNLNYSTMSKLKNLYIRLYCDPSTVFENYASLKLKSRIGSESYMTPDDFVASICNNMDYVKNEKVIDIDEKIDEKYKKDYYSSFRKLNKNALISLPLYTILRTLILYMPDDIEMGLKLMDFNSDGNVTSEDFVKLILSFYKKSIYGPNHKDTTNIMKSLEDINFFINYFKGSKNEELNIDKFMIFFKELKNNVMEIEFNLYNPENGKISQKDFANLLSSHIAFFICKFPNIFGSFKDDKTITFSDYVNFNELGKNVDDIELALDFYNNSQKDTSYAQDIKEALQTVSQRLYNIKLSQEFLDTFFDLLRINGPIYTFRGNIKNDKIVSFLKDERLRGHANYYHNSYINELYYLINK